MNIAIMSHDNRKDLMVQFCTAYAGILSQHNLYATNTTGHMVAEATGLKVHCFLSYAHGGSQQIGARIAYNEFDLVLFFNDPGNAQSVMVSGIDQSTVDSVTDILVQDPSPTIDGIDKSMSSSTAYVTADTGEGGSVSYQVQMSRDLIGWKVSDVSLYFPSQH